MKPPPCDVSLAAPRFSGLSGPRQALVRLCQSIDYGEIIGLEVRDREPIFCPPPVILFDIKLDTDTDGRREGDLQDFLLRDEVCRLFRRLDSLDNGRLDRIEIRAGIPRRLRMQAPLMEAPR